MPLPRLKTFHVDDANAREAAKQALLGVPVTAAPISVTEDNHSAIQLRKSISDSEKELLRVSELEPARKALESRQGRIEWLSGVVVGAIKTQGAFGMSREFGESSKLAAMKLLADMNGDRTVKHTVDVAVQHVFVIPDNGRLPADMIDVMPELEAENV